MSDLAETMGKWARHISSIPENNDNRALFVALTLAENDAQDAADELFRLKEWREARKAFLALPAGDTGIREALNRLSDAEDKLYRGAE